MTPDLTLATRRARHCAESEIVQAAHTLYDAATRDLSSPINLDNLRGAVSRLSALIDALESIP